MAHAPPRLIKGIRIVDRKHHFHRISAIGHAPTLDDMHFVGVRCAIDIGDGLVAQADRINNQSVTFIMADRFAVPGRLHIV